MPPEVNVATSPMIVYGMVAVLGVAIVLALVFAWPRHGLGAVKRSDVPDHVPGGLPWMPGGDIFGEESQPEPEPQAAVESWQPAADLWQAPADPWQATPPAAPPPSDSLPPSQDPWATGATGNAEPQTRSDKC